MEILKKFLNSNLLIALTTLVVGGIALFIYIKQKRDYKRNVASLILQEVRYAEQHIRNYKVFKKYPLACKLVPINNWYSNINLFARDFKETDIDLISNFYAQATYIDGVIKSISDAKISSLVPVGPAGAMPPQATPNGQPQIAPQQFDLGAQTILKDVSVSVEFIYNTPAIDKLRDIAKKKWYQII